jgi:small subunit ribosomal protein S20
VPAKRDNKSAEKCIRQDKKRRVAHRIVKGFMRETVRNFRDIDEKKTATENLPQTYSIIDRAAKKKAIHTKTASRLKSRMAKHLNKIEETAK